MGFEGKGVLAREKVGEVARGELASESASTAAAVDRMKEA